jgi:hypothetical protein
MTVSSLYDKAPISLSVNIQSQWHHFCVSAY